MFEGGGVQKNSYCNACTNEGMAMIVTIVGTVGCFLASCFHCTFDCANHVKIIWKCTNCN